MVRHVTITAVAAFALVATACSAEDLVENAVENAVERESGEDVDIDFGDGGFSIETEDGSMTMDEDGNMVITDENGSVVTGNIDAEDGSFTVEDESGEVVFESDGEGNTVIQTEDGTMSTGSATEVPDSWPGEVPEPTGIEIQAATQFDDASGVATTVTGTVGDGKAWVDQYTEDVLGAGFTEQSKLETPESVFVGFESERYEVSIQVFDNGDGSWLASVAAIQR